MEHSRLPSSNFHKLYPLKPAVQLPKKMATFCPSKYLDLPVKAALNGSVIRVFSSHHSLGWISGTPDGWVFLYTFPDGSCIMWDCCFGFRRLAGLPKGYKNGYIRAFKERWSPPSNLLHGPLLVVPRCPMMIAHASVGLPTRKCCLRRTPTFSAAWRQDSFPSCSTKVCGQFLVCGFKCKGRGMFQVLHWCHHK